VGDYVNLEYEYGPVEHDAVCCPKVSVIVPVYNVEKYLKQCLKSIEQQSFEDFEVICIDDGSTDGSLKILQHYASIDKRFFVISQENQGQGVARNNAIDLARGEYILFVDPDDWIEFNTLKVLYANALQSGAEIIQFNFKDFNEVTKSVKVRNFAEKMKKKYNLVLNHQDFYEWRNVKNAVLIDFHKSVWTYFFSKDFIKKNNLRFAPVKVAEDHVFSINAILSVDKVFYIEDCFYNYRCRSGSAVEIVSDDNFCVFDVIENVKNILTTKGLFIELEKSFRRYSMELMAIRYECVPMQSLTRYENECKNYLSKFQYFTFRLRTKHIYSIAEWCFSVKNRRKNGVKYKQIVVLGFIFSL